MLLAIAGMVKLEHEERAEEEKPLVAATMFGVTTPCIDMAREFLEGQGYEVQYSMLQELEVRLWKG